MLNSDEVKELEAQGFKLNLDERSRSCRVSMFIEFASDSQKFRITLESFSNYIAVHIKNKVWKNEFEFTVGNYKDLQLLIDVLLRFSDRLGININ